MGGSCFFAMMRHFFLPLLLTLLPMQRVFGGSIELFPGLFLACGGRTCSQRNLAKSTQSRDPIHKTVHAFVSGQTFVFAVINSHLDDEEKSYTENITLIITNYDQTIAADITITSPFMTLPNNQFTVPAAGIYSYMLPTEIQTNYRNLQANYIVPSNKSITMKSKNARVSLVVKNARSNGFSEDDYVIYPACTLGNQYHSVGDESIWRGHNSTSIWSIVATQDNTLVAIYPPLAPINFTLQTGEVLTFSSNIYPMSNYRIITSAPTAVVAGAVCGYGYYNQDICNHEAVMLFPLSDSGTAFPYTQFLAEDEGEVMCFAAQNRTTISLDGDPWQYMDATEYVLLRVDGSLMITFDKPAYAIAVGSMRSDRMGSPFMAHIPAISQFTNESRIMVQTGLTDRTFSTHYIRIQTDLLKTGKIWVDDWEIDPLFFQRQGKSNSYVADWPVKSGNHIVRSDGQAGTLFAVTVYGFAPLTAYAFTPGIDLAEVNDVDARAILSPIMSPFVQMFDIMQENSKAKAYADKIEKAKDDSPFSNSKGLFDLFEKLQRPTTTTTPAPSLMQQLLQPYWEPWQRQFDSISKEMAGITLIPTTTTTPPPTTTSPKSLLERSLGMFLPAFTAATTTKKPEIRRSPQKLFEPEVFDHLFELFNPNKKHLNRFKRQSDFRLPDAFQMQPIPDFLSPKGLQKLLEVPALPTIHPPPSPLAPLSIKPTDSPILDLLNPLKPNLILEELNKPINLSNPFTPNPLMGLFTTKKPIPDLRVPLAQSKPIEAPPAFNSPFKLQDPFYNPLYPDKRSKLFDILAGGEAARILG
ncbi:unnamed protein product, partial [Mesorhabditis belari]|uniref:IgGFc-binding protein N-terminal domain-containing protein n=1 Tax=Mesorhabditis belari TaxID=2138241 RepID=A0AAF3EAC2_9BILA